MIKPNEKPIEFPVTFVGLGAGDPQQRLAKFASAMSVAGPLLQQSPAFQSGEKQVDDEAVMEEVFGAAGYRETDPLGDPHPLHAPTTVCPS